MRKTKIRQRRTIVKLLQLTYNNAFIEYIFNTQYAIEDTFTSKLTHTESWGQDNEKPTKDAIVVQEIEPKT